MKITLNLECPRCGGKLVLSEDRHSVKIQCPTCKLSAKLSITEVSRKAIKYIDGELIFDWSAIIDDLYFEIALSSNRG